jgi:hypothetical protein
MATKKKSLVLRRAAIVAITLIVLLIPLALYYVFYVLAQRDYFIDRSHRSLAGIGNQVASRIDGLRDVVENAAKKRCLEGDTQEDLNDLQGFFESLKPFGVTLKLESSSALSEDELNTEKPAPQKSPVTVEFKRRGTDERLLLNYEFIANDTVESTLRPGRFAVSASTDDLLKPAAERYLIRERRTAAEDMFDMVLVADSETGDVVFQYGPGLPISVSNASELVNANQKDSSKHDEKAAEVEKDISDKVSRGMSGTVPITIAKIDYRLFFQPIQLTAPKSGAKENQGFNLMVLGMVRADYALKRTFAFTSYMLLLFAVISMLVVTGSGPLIKLKLLGPKDRLCARDAILAIASALFVTTLLTLGILDVYTHSTLERQLDGQLERLGADLSTNLKSELAYAVDQLDQLNEQLQNKLTLANSECYGSPKESDAVGEQAGRKEQMYVVNLLNYDFILDPLSAPYPYFNSATWSNYDGQQQIKFTTRPKHTPFINVASRPYFNEAKEGRTWTLTGETDKKRRTFYLDSVNSMTTGDNVAVISKQVPQTVDQPGERYVSTMDTRLLSLYDPVIPPGYGFCVINNVGDVLFHSDDLKNLLENFFDECRNNRALRAAVRSRTSETMDVKYLGRDHRVRVTPLEAFPWTLVVFRDKQLLRTMNLETITLTSYLCLAYGALVTLALILIFAFLPGAKERRKIIWPTAQEQDRDRYKQMFVVNSALFLSCLLLTALFDGGFIWIVAVLFPSLALAHTLWLLSKRKPEPRKLPEIAWLSDWRRLYVLALVSMLAVGCVAPAFSFFKLMREEEIRIFLRHGQMSLAMKLQERETRIRKLYPPPDPPTDNGAANDKFVQTRLNWKLDINEVFFFGTESSETKVVDQEPSGGLLCWFLTSLSPFYNEVCVESVQLARGRASDKTWASWQEGNKALLGVRPSASYPRSSDSSSDSDQQPLRWLKMESTLPAFISFTNPYSWLLIPAFLLLLIGAYFAVRLACCRVVLLDLPDARGRSLDPADKIDRNHLVVGPPSLERSRIFVKHPFVYFDIASISQESWWKIKNRIDKDSLNTPVVLDRFDAHKEDYKWNQLKIDLVRELLTENARRIVIVSAANPVDFPLSDLTTDNHDNSAKVEGAKAGGGAGTAAALKSSPDNKPDPQRWTEVLSSFARETAVNGDDPKARNLLNTSTEGHDPISEEPINPESEELIAREADQLEAYYRGIWEGCSVNERMTLYRVAKDGFVSRFDPDLRPLMQRGLIVRNPDLNLMLPSFRAFVLRICVAQGLHLLQSDEPSNWERWKVPLILVILAMIAFLFSTQRDLYDNTVYVVTGVTGGLMALLRLIGLFQSKTAGAGSQS